MKRLTVICAALLVGAAPAPVLAAAKKTIKPGTRVVWRWPSEAGDVHDVKLKSGPKGVKKFHSEGAATDYEFKRKLTVAGTYKIVCTLHEEMRMTVKVRR